MTLPTEAQLRQAVADDIADADRRYARVPVGTYGPFSGSPDEAKQARIEREDAESLWESLLASAPDVDHEENDA